MADAATADGSLTDKFNMKSLWHWSHWLMVGGIVCGVFAAVATSGASVGVLDVVWQSGGGFLDMVFGGYAEIGDAIGGVSSVFENTANGVLVTGDAIPYSHDMGHGLVSSASGHVGSGGLLEHCSEDTANSLFGGMSGAEFEAHKAQAGAFRGGDMVGHLGDLCHE